MAFFTEIYQVDMTPGTTKFPTIHVSQYDNLSRKLSFELMYKGERWEIPFGTEALIIGTKPDGLGFMIPGTIIDSIVSFTVRDSMTAIGGLVPCEIRITQGEDIVIGSANFILAVECAAMDDNTAISDADIAALEELLRQYREFSYLEAVAHTLPAGEPATASYSGSVFTFGIPTGPAGEPGKDGKDGEDGKAATVTVGSTQTISPDDPAEVYNSGTDSNAVLNFRIPRGAKGADGAPGKDGMDGIDGVSPTIAVGQTTTGAPGTNASVNNTGTSTDAVLNFTIPRGNPGQDGKDGKDGKDGEDGKAATVTVGSTQTISPDDPAEVYNSGTDSNAVLNFRIPRGAKGADGAPGKDGMDGVDGLPGKDGKDGKDGCLCAVEDTTLVITTVQASGMEDRY